MESTFDSRAAIQEIVPIVLRLVQPLAPNDPVEQKFLAVVHLKSMYRQMSAFKNRDEEALDEIQRQIQLLSQ